MNLQQRQAKRAQAADQRDRASDHGPGHPPGPTGLRPSRAPRATGNAAVLRRLRKGFSELHGLVLAGKLTAYQAAVAAGFRGRKRKRPVVVSHPAGMITPLQEMELWLGPSHHGSAFSDDEQRRRLWAAHRERLMRWWGTDGRRPQAWWRYDAPNIPYPGYARERSTLFAAGLLSKRELAALTVEWRAEFQRAWEPSFAFVAAPGEIYQGAVARQKHFAWADIPSALVQKWEGARQRAD
jgi:hypothetical protein